MQCNIKYMHANLLKKPAVKFVHTLFYYLLIQYATSDSIFFGIIFQSNACSKCEAKSTLYNRRFEPKNVTNEPKLRRIDILRQACGNRRRQKGDKKQRSRYGQRLCRSPPRRAHRQRQHRPGRRRIRPVVPPETVVFRGDLDGHVDARLLRVNICNAAVAASIGSPIHCAVASIVASSVVRRLSAVVVVGMVLSWFGRSDCRTSRFWRRSTFTAAVVVVVVDRSITWSDYVVVVVVPLDRKCCRRRRVEIYAKHAD